LDQHCLASRNSSTRLEYKASCAGPTTLKRSGFAEEIAGASRGNFFIDEHQKLVESGKLCGIAGREANRPKPGTPLCLATHPWAPNRLRQARANSFISFVGAAMPTGNVKWFDSKKGFGFIINPEGKDVFVHFTSIEGDGFRSLKDGEKVDYEQIQGEKGLLAQHVKRVAAAAAAAAAAKANEAPAPAQPA
jgi:CspA family cold shock protein